MAPEPLNDYKTHPRMVHWFNPILLYKLLNNVVTSAMFGQYADRRLMVAALDTVPDDKHLKRATSLKECLKPDADGAVWFDFVADLGDGFDSTYAVASLLARPQLALGEAQLPRGQMLIMGGDEVYPLANTQTYRNQLRKPYAWAFPDRDRKDDAGVPLYAIPGNHDWYDGLVQFLAYFCRDKPTHFGNWRTRQRRSYFALQLSPTWWLWAIDIQLADDMDQPQADYFTIIARSKELLPDSRIILCSAEPGWLYGDTNVRSWEIADYAIWIADRAGKDLCLPLLMSGDTHHYSRYAAADGTQFVTAGGGGAFLHPTHQLERDMELRWNGKPKPLTLGTRTAPDAAPGEPAVYPSFAVSRRLVWRNLWFAITNWDFSLLMAAIYILVGVLIGLRDRPDAYLFVALLMGAGIIGYTTAQEKVSVTEIVRKWRQRRWTPKEFDTLASAKLWLQFKKALIVIGSSVVHTAAHVLVAIVAARGFAAYNAGIDFNAAWSSVWRWLGALAIEMGPVGFLAGGTLFGLNMLITCRWLRMNRNDAFSALRIGRYNNFLRLRLKDDEVQVFAIGLEDVPQRDDWRENPRYRDGHPDEPRWIAADPLRPHLIETFCVRGGAGRASGA